MSWRGEERDPHSFSVFSHRSSQDQIIHSERVVNLCIGSGQSPIPTPPFLATFAIEKCLASSTILQRLMEARWRNDRAARLHSRSRTLRKWMN